MFLIYYYFKKYKNIVYFKHKNRFLKTKKLKYSNNDIKKIISSIYQ